MGNLASRRPTSADTDVLDGLAFRENGATVSELKELVTCANPRNHLYRLRSQGFARVSGTKGAENIWVLTHAGRLLAGHLGLPRPRQEVRYVTVPRQDFDVLLELAALYLDAEAGRTPMRVRRTHAAEVAGILARHDRRRPDAGLRAG